MRELVHVAFDQLLIFEHDAGTPLRIGRGPAGLRRLGGIDCLLEVGGGPKPDLRLDLALVGVEHLTLSLSASEGGTADEMVDAAKHGYASWYLGVWDWCPPRPGCSRIPVGGY